ncbi:hypothetical protein LCGC14_1013640 [marine sediment metagenome]|uniref:Uncharacterized protein n=1 Tax=marine sediment metagenome TaxID=412755 RepID=A0A0F9R5K7_9ZZZZ
MKKLLFILVMSMFLVSLVSAEIQFLPGATKRLDPINLLQTCENCTFMNLTQVIATSPNSIYVLQPGQFSMTKNDQNYNYTFLNTSLTGTYIYSTCGDLDGVLECGSVRFIVNNTGVILTGPEIVIYFVMIIFFFMISIFFLYWGFTFPFNNEVNEDGTITQISKKKYLKLLSLMFFFGFFLWTISMLSFVSNSFVSLETFSSIITNFYIFFYILTLGVTVTILFTFMIMFYWDLFYSKEIRKFGKAFIKSIK